MATEPIPPPYVITEDDQRGLIVVITATTLSFVWVCLLIRIWLRAKTREWRSDDYFLAAATFLDTVQSGLVFHVVNEGLGKTQVDLVSSDLNRIGKYDFASQLLYVFTLFLSKCAVLFLYLRLSPEKRHVVVSWATIAASAVWALAAIVLVAVPCQPDEFWQEGPGHCSTLWPRWQAIGVIDIISEAVIFAISVYLVAQLHMAKKSKVMVVAAFSARLPVIIASAFRLHYLHSTIVADDRTLEGAKYVVATQWHIGYAIMSTTITGIGPFLRPFGKSFSTSYRRSSYSHHPSVPASSLGDSHTKSHAGSYQMHPLKAPQVNVTASGSRGSASSSSPQGSTNNTHLILRPESDACQQNTAVTGGRRAPSAGDEEDTLSRLSHESTQWIIKKKTELKVESDRASGIGVAA